MCSSTCDAGSRGRDEFIEFRSCCHGGIPRRGGSVGTVGGTVVHSGLRIVFRKKSVHESAGKAIATTDAIQNFQFRIFAAFVKLTIVPAEAAPIVAGGADDPAHGRRNDFQVR